MRESWAISANEAKCIGSTWVPWFCSQLRNAHMCAGVTRRTMSQCEKGRKVYFTTGGEGNLWSHIFYLLSNRHYDVILWRQLKNWHRMILSRNKLWESQEIISSSQNCFLNLDGTFVEGQGLKRGGNNWTSPLRCKLLVSVPLFQNLIKTNKSKQD